MEHHYYGPINEDKFTIEYERNFIAGDVVVGTGYGIQLALYLNCARYLWMQRRHSRRPMFLLGYMTTMLLIESLFVAVQARTVQFVYVDNRNYPGKQHFYLFPPAKLRTAAVNVIFYATLFLLTFLSDLFVLWRCWVVWSTSGQHKLALGVIVFPIILVLASFVMGTLWTLQSSQPTLSMYSVQPLAYGTSYYAISLSLNIILTLLIIGRLLLYRRSLLKDLPVAYGAHYISLITIVVESAALYTVFAILFLITYALNNPTNQVWLAVGSASQQIANLLIIYRIADGSAWTKDTLTATAALPSFQSRINDGCISTHISDFHFTVPPSVDCSPNLELKEVARV
ncbi:hypothetical protein MVEN_00587300 [Mycena venus]|uniref:Uncharacterized protein n=1 Tax=Mycena venus TaxID=2733690 RepID=A0A8H6YPF0_9AGAR|nr:hypothetical protein MVEN_00587300 [Mycena venus]